MNDNSYYNYPGQWTLWGVMCLVTASHSPEIQTLEKTELYSKAEALAPLEIFSFPIRSLTDTGPGVWKNDTLPSRR